MYFVARDVSSVSAKMTSDEFMLYVVVDCRGINRKIKINNGNTESSVYLVHM